MGTLLTDLRYALRTLARNPGFAIVAVLTLALGIGANTVIFSTINGLYLHPAGVADPTHVFVMRTRYEKLGLKSLTLSTPAFRDVRDSRQIFSSAAASDEESFNYLAPDGPRRLRVAQVTAEWFDTFGARPQLGRLFRPEEDQPKANHVALLSYDTWTQLFGADPAVVGREIQLNGESYRIVGVMGANFDWPRRSQLWIPLGLAPSAFAVDNYFNESVLVVARTRPEVSQQQADAYLGVLRRRLIEAHPETTYPKDSGWGLFALPFSEYTSGDLRAPMLILLGAVGFVLLIACSNIGGLLLARASTRSREFAVRVALGAQKSDLLRPALAESSLLSVCGAVAGLAAAYAGTNVMLRAVVGSLSSRLAVHVDGTVLLFAGALTLLTGLFLGLMPIGEVLGRPQCGILKDGARSITSSRRRLRIREWLVAGQVALSLVLLVGAGLLLKSLVRMASVDKGFDSRAVTTANIQLPDNRYNSQERQTAFYRAVNERLAALPGVSAAGLGLALPLSGFDPTSSFIIEGRTVGPREPGPVSRLNWVTPGYFATLGIPLRSGRYFTAQDGLETEPVVVIDESLVQQYWPGQNPVGEHLRRGPDAPWATIVGVVGHVTQFELVGDSGQGICYYPMLQQPLSQAFLVVKSRTGASQLAGAIRSAVGAVDAAQPVADLTTMDEYVSRSLGPQRIVVSLLEVFSVVALFLVSLGLYGVISYNTAQRTQEIGIRMALGARRREVAGIVIYQGMRLTVAGILAGAIAAALLTSLIRSQLYEVSASDPSTFALTCVILSVVSLAACYIPAWRASRVDPIVALRYE